MPGQQRAREKSRRSPAEGSVERVIRRPHDVELDAEQNRVIVDRSGMRSATAKALTVGFSGQHEVLVADRGERQELDVVALDDHRTAAIDATDFDLRP